METKMISISQIKPWKDNPRKNEGAAQKLAELIKVYGVRSPIVVWKKNMVVYKGNTTLKACKLLGMKEIPVAYAEFKTEAEAVAYGLADNKSSEWAEWDDELLEKIFASGNAPEGLTGFTEKEVQGLTFGFDTKAVDNIKEDINAKLKARVVVVACNEEDAREIKETLKEWAATSGFAGVEIK